MATNKQRAKQHATHEATPLTWQLFRLRTQLEEAGERLSALERDLAAVQRQVGAGERSG